jgi:crossover junction endodeoxyribonuclease RuvC
MLILAIDPGTVGAYAALGPDGVVELDDLPVHQIGRAGTKALRAELSLHALCAILQRLKPQHVFIEWAGPRPREGTSSSWRFAYACGSLYGAVAALGLPCTFVQPKAWQRHHGIGSAPDAAIRRALQLYPHLVDRLTRKRDNHRADAVLIAAFGQHTLRPERAAA